MVICEIFELLENPERVEIEMLLSDYQKAWAEFDPKATGKVKPADLYGLFYALDKPLGAGPMPTILYSKFRIDLMQRQRGFDYSFHTVLTYMVAMGGIPSSFSSVLQDEGYALRTLKPIVLIQRCLRRYIHNFRKRKKAKEKARWERVKQRVSTTSSLGSHGSVSSMMKSRRSSGNSKHNRSSPGNASSASHPSNYSKHNL